MTNHSSYIAGLGFYVPDRVLTNRELEKMVETSDEWIRTRTGISERRIAEKGVGTSELASRAALAALKQAGVSPNDVDLIIAATTTPDMPLPSCACFIQQKIGAKNAPHGSKFRSQREVCFAPCLAVLNAGAMSS